MRKLQWEQMIVMLLILLSSSIALSGCIPRNRKPQNRASSAIPKKTLSNPIVRLGQKQGLVFSPDLTAAGNRELYEALGFVYWEGAEWQSILAQIRRHNEEHPAEPVEQIFLETHGSNGKGLKVQASADPAAPRSYISLGGLQQHLEGTGITRLILTACNTGPLFNPEIYRRLRLDPRQDPRLLPATWGVVNASLDYEPSCSAIQLLRRSDSRIEQSIKGHYRELSPSLRQALGLQDPKASFVVSNLFMQMMLKDVRLQLTGSGYVRRVSSWKEEKAENEAIYRDFLQHLDRMAAANNS